MGRSLRGRFSGVVRYTDALVHALAPALGKRLTVFVTRAEDGLDGLDVQRVRAPFPTPNEYARAFWEQVVVPFEVRRRRIDVYHSPNYILPVAVACPTVVTVHDLAFLDPRLQRRRSRLYLTALTRVAAAKATLVICVSAYTRDALLARFPALAGRVRVVGEGVDERFQPAPGAAVEEFRRRHGLEAPYVLFVGTIEPRKNLVRLIRAFERAADHGLPHDLVLGGARGWMDEGVLSARERSPHRRRIRLLGYLSESDLPAAYTGAAAFAYPSLAEGFGLPPLEAMACGTPVITSAVTALPEVAGDAAVLVDPLDVEALGHGLERLLGDDALRSELRHRGFRQAARFRWSEVARATEAVYAEAAG